MSRPINTATEYTQLHLHRFPTALRLDLLAYRAQLAVEEVEEEQGRIRSLEEMIPELLRVGLRVGREEKKKRRRRKS